VPDTGPRRNLALGLLGLLAVAGLAAVRLAALAHAAPTDFDDAYMYLRYALHLLDGQGLAWNPGERSVYGVTSLLHLAVVVIVKAIFPSLAPAAVLQTASGGAAIGLVAALIAIAALCSRHRRLHRNWIFWTAVILPLVAFREAFGFHASTGMDTMLSALANAVLVFCTLQFARAPTASRARWVALVSLLAVLARPDNLLCAILCPVLAVVLIAPKSKGKPVATFVLILGGLLAILVLGEWLLLGSPLPLSFFAKRPGYYAGFAGEFTWNPFLFLKVFALSAWPFIVALILFANRAGLRRAAVLLLPALATMLILCRFNQIMGHLGRFYYPFLPYFVAAGALEFDAWLGRPSAGQSRGPAAMLWRAGMAGGAILAGSLLLSVAADLYSGRAQAQKLQSMDGFHTSAQAPLPELDSWQSARAIADMARAAPAGTSFAMSEHGLPGALAPQMTIIDVLGLHDPYFARHGFSATELFRRKPDVIWLPHSDHTQMLRDILDSDDFWNHYAFYPDAFFHGLALRTDGPHNARLVELLSAQWQKAYPGLPFADYQAMRGN
jgi:hypothetical protein